MSLAVRIIPTLLMRGDQLVKGKQFNAWRSVGHIEQAMRIYQARAVDEVILLDIAATDEGRRPDFDRVQQLTHDFFTPVTVGGGIQTQADIRKLLAAGADKVAIGCAAHHAFYKGGKMHYFIEDAAKRFGGQAIVVAIDVKDGYAHTHNGTQNTRRFAHDCARFMQNLDVGEILLTSIKREGTMEGYDLELIRAVSDAVDIPVIAHGGCSGYPDMLAAIQAGAHAVAAGALFQFTDATPRGAAEYLAAHGIETRVTA